MDEQRFDQLSRRLGASRTRRQALRAIAGAVVAGVAGITATEAQACTAHHKRCSSDGQCCSGAVCEYGRCMPGCRIDGAYHPAGMSPGGDICQVCAPEVSTTAWSPANDGVPCWSGSANAGATTCQRGACAPVAVVTPVPCPPLTPCHLAGQVDPATGMCVHPPAPAGTPCGIGEMCHGGVYQPADACDGNGFCIGGGSKAVSCAPYPCAGTACATDCSSDSECGNSTICCEGACVALGTSDHCGACGDICASDGCTTASCANGVCTRTSLCTPVDACTPAKCLEAGTCNQLTACTGFETCGGGGVENQCGCTPDNLVCQVSCNEGDGCGGACAGQAATSPAISVSFGYIDYSDTIKLCVPTIMITGFTGCTSYEAEYRISGGAGGTFSDSRHLNRTDRTGTSYTQLPAFERQSGSIWVEIGDVYSSDYSTFCAAT